MPLQHFILTNTTGLTCCSSTWADSFPLSETFTVLLVKRNEISQICFTSFFLVWPLLRRYNKDVNLVYFQSRVELPQTFFNFVLKVWPRM
ncbi:hypothetical protein H4Q32_023352 [Labeo rohita]|uniref:Uncharacterized protein n=1 Tax=Labeo rohita TaxID=84645 RepID=A0ABQ8M937_LABRO|nr:hypothetical protein H4Q32_023352 [Labeo rohita]